MTQDGRFSLAHGECMTKVAGDGTLPVDVTSRPSEAVSAGIARGVGRLLMAHDVVFVTELVLPDGRRADVVAISAAGTVSIIEIKSSVPDFRSDHKWTDYRAYCDRFYFAVDATFPAAILPVDTGLILADRYGGAYSREAPEHKLAAARRKAMILRFGRVAAARLASVNDPALPMERL